MSKIMGFKDLQKKDNGDGKNDQYFAGGLDQRGGGSGQNVVGPPQPSSSVSDRIRERYEAQDQDRGSTGDEMQSDARTVTLYRNGFTLDDGPLRDLDSPESIEFLNSLYNGRVPAEISAGGKDVSVNFADKHGEDYVAPPPPAFVPFSGGVTLGGPSISEGAVVVDPELLKILPPSPVVDESQPVTTIQIRTLTGRRLRIRINQNATVMQLVAMIKSQYETPERYTLTAGFPPRDVENITQTIASAGLLNAAITLKKC